MEINGKPYNPMASNQAKATFGDENFDDIILTPQEIQEALRVAREAKFYIQRRQEYFQSLDAPTSRFKPTTDQWKIAHGEKYIQDAENIEVVGQLCAYFAQDAALFKGDLKKGILLFGGIGTGKTALMRFFRQNAAQSFRIVSARTIENEYSAGGEEIIPLYSDDKKIAVNADPWGHQKLALCIDDIGTETQGKHYGKDRNVIEEIILNRYDAGVITHCTTNLDAAALRAFYGDRAMDRIKEMVNIIQFPPTAKSRRK